MRMEFEMEMNSRTRTAKTENTQSKHNSIVFSIHTYLQDCKKRYDEMRREAKKCLEFASIYTHIVCDYSLAPARLGSFSLQSFLNMCMRSLTLF